MRVILIGGSSNAGKSTIAKKMALKLGWSYLSTDSLARHPGRPWRVGQKSVPKHVIEHYSSLSVDELLANVLHHYQGIWPKIEAIISMYATDFLNNRLILEGSALWPESVTTLDVENTKPIWLTAEKEQFQKRIYRESNFDARSAQEQYLIDKFLGRTLLYNEKMMATINRLNLMSIKVKDTNSPAELAEMCLKMLK